MSTETNPSKNEPRGRTRVINNAGSAPIYGLGFIGALVYFIQHAATFWIGVLGFFKAVVWPALVVYKLLEFLHM
jgi:hypothetical protein